MADELKPRARRRSRATRKSGLPKGGYRLPEGGIVVPGKKEPGSKVVITGVLREEPDIEALQQAMMLGAIEIAREKDPANKAAYDALERQVAKSHVFKDVQGVDRRDEMV